ncbi:MAG: MGH1-like glycoside hydrolase domain-containing protein [Promethearchaeota archaeon]
MGSSIPYTNLQLDFDKKLWKQLGHCFIFTFFRIVFNKNFWIFLFMLLFGISFAFGMMWFTISIIEGIFVVFSLPFIIFLLVCLILYKFINSALRMKIIKWNKEYQIATIPEISIDLIEKVLKKVETVETVETVEIVNNNINSNSNKENANAIFAMYNEVFRLLDLNLIKPFGKIKTYFSVPAPKYPAPYLWDTAFISQIWRIWDPKIAFEILKPFLYLQRNDGACPKEIAFGIFPNYKITNPPLLSWVLNEICKFQNDYSIFEKEPELYEALRKFNNYFYKNRLKNGLFFWKHAYESGLDNSPRFANTSESKFYDIENVWAVDLNSWMVLDNISLAEIAFQTNKKEDYEIFKNKAEELIVKINEILWNEDEAMYFDYNFQKKKHIKIKTIASFFPLIAGIPRKEQAEKLVMHLKNENEFNTEIPLPTVSLDDPNFEKDCWRGPVWINTAYIVIKGLQKYGYFNLSCQFTYKILKGVAKTLENEGSIYEFYDPECYYIHKLNRKKGNFLKKITLGNKPVKKFVGWSGLVNTLLIEDFLSFSDNTYND